MTGQDNMFLPILIENAPAPVTEKGRNLWTVLNGRTYWLAEMTPESFDELAQAGEKKSRLQGAAARSVAEPDDYHWVEYRLDL